VAIRSNARSGFFGTCLNSLLQRLVDEIRQGFQVRLLIKLPLERRDKPIKFAVFFL
jgi:hypothetical protein